MKKVLLIIYYEIVDYLLSIKNQLEKFHMDVIIYPLFKYAYDVNSKIINYKEDLNKFIVNNEPDIVLWWFLDVPLDVFTFVIQNNRNAYYIMYNSDDPENLDKELFDKCKLFDLIITPCEESIYLYKTFSDKTACFIPFGYDENDIYSLPKELYTGEDYENYSCDICIHIQNLYSDEKKYPHQFVCCTGFINDIIKYCKEKKKKIYIYGPYIINDFFPQYYRGLLPYSKQKFAYNFSKINITLHLNCKISLHTNNILFPMLASGNILMIDRVKNFDKILTDSKDCIFIDDKNYINQVNEILENYNKYEYIKTNAIETAKKYSWYNWVKKIVYHYSIEHFDGDFYSKLYNIDKNENLLEYWKNRFDDKMEICYKFNVPKNFLCNKYRNDNFLHKYSDELSYLDWHMKSKNDKYLSNIPKQNKNKHIDLENHITMDLYYNICTILEKIRNNNERDKNLLLLGNFVNKLCLENINDILDKYLESVE